MSQFVQGWSGCNLQCPLAIGLVYGGKVRGCQGLARKGGEPLTCAGWQALRLQSRRSHHLKGVLDSTHASGLSRGGGRHEERGRKGQGGGAKPCTFPMRYRSPFQPAPKAAILRIPTASAPRAFFAASACCWGRPQGFWAAF